MNIFLIVVALLQFSSAIYDYFAGNAMRSMLMVLYGFTNIVLAFMEV